VEQLLAAFPPVEGLVFGSTACGASRAVGALLDSIATSIAEREWRSLGARSLGEARAYAVSTTRQHMSFVAARAHARLRLSRLEVVASSGRTAERYALSGTGWLASPSAFDSYAARGGGR